MGNEKYGIEEFWEEAQELDRSAPQRDKDQGKVYNLLSTHGDPVRIAEGLGELIEAVKAEDAASKHLENLLIDVAQGKPRMEAVFDFQGEANAARARLRRALKAIGGE